MDRTLTGDWSKRSVGECNPAVAHEMWRKMCYWRGFPPLIKGSLESLFFLPAPRLVWWLGLWQLSKTVRESLGELQSSVRHWGTGCRYRRAPRASRVSRRRTWVVRLTATGPAVSHALREQEGRGAGWRTKDVAGTVTLLQEASSLGDFTVCPCGIHGIL